MNEEDRPPELTIHIQSGAQTGRHYTFTKERVTLGRSSSNDIVLSSDTSVSAHHARLVRQGDYWEIEDRDSKNGLYSEHEGCRSRILDATRVSEENLYLIGLTLIRVSTGETPSQENENVTMALDRSTRPNRVLRVVVIEDEIRFQLLSDDACAAEYASPYRPDAISALNESIRMQVQRARMAEGAVAVTAAKELLRIGATLTEQLLPSRLQRELAKAADGPLFLILDPRLISVPWELAQLHGEALCLQFDMGRQVLVEDFTLRRAGYDMIPAEGMLIAADPLGDFEPARAQAEGLYNFLRDNAPSLNVSFLSGGRITRLGLIERLNHSRCVYFNGHIEYDDAHPENSAWVLKDALLRCEDFSRLSNPPQFVFANGCESCREPEWNGTESSYGMASAFLMSGVRSYAGTLWPIPPEPSGQFARAFFTHLLEGAPIGAALRSARLALRSSENGASATWASYILYGNPANRPL